ncbi:rabphilin-3A [Trichinella spiralis]|uniref:rabphilin-3A n=1 Tax=Trichinella spiralis TaxID=6334 RepID=UPI0001EFC69B|nr:rabphilin-3A [Trichinella spiralis]
MFLLPVSGTFAPGDVPGTFVASLPPLSGRAPPSRGRASIFLARSTTRGRSGRSAPHLHGGCTGTSVDAAAFSGGPSRARASILRVDLISSTNYTTFSKCALSTRMPDLMRHKCS